MGMSIPQTSENSNIFYKKVPDFFVLAVLLISIGLLSFALGRISAFSEIRSVEQGIIIHNSEIL